MLDTSGATAFFKLTGAGNDFIALVSRGEASTPPVEQVRAWCRRGMSLGADGVMVLRRAAAGARMIHWNADGSRADLCLNGSRAALRLLAALGWTGEDGWMALETDAGMLSGRALDDSQVEVTLPGGLAPVDDEGAIRPMRLPLADGAVVEGYRIEVGVPHLVVTRDDLEHVPIAQLGPQLRRHADLGEAGANVDFVDWQPRSLGHAALRTWERGVEGETLACGTGVVATVCVGLATDQLSLPATLRTASGFDLTVDRLADGRLTLAGDARIVARGELLGGASVAPPKDR